MNDQYLAGVFDGEGSISAYINTRKSWVMRCNLEMANEEIPHLFLNRFGGSIHKRKKLTVGGLQLWQWYISGSKCCDFLSFVINNCLIKNKMAELALPIAINMQDYISGKSRKGINIRRGRNALSKEDRVFRDQQFKKIKSLNGARSRFQ